MFRHYTTINKHLIIESDHSIAINLNLNYFFIFLDNINHQDMKSLTSIHSVYYTQNNNIDWDLIQ